MIEVIVGLGIVALIFAFLYSQQAKEALWSRILFLSMALLTVPIIGWVMMQATVTKTISTYDVTDTLTQTQILTTSLESGPRGVLSVYVEASLYVFYIVIIITLMMLVWNVVAEVLEARKQDSI